jgi:hypothetical protein
VRTQLAAQIPHAIAIRVSAVGAVSGGPDHLGGVTGLFDSSTSGCTAIRAGITTRSPFSSRFTRAITLSIVLSLFPIQAAQAAQVKEATFP